ncbi:hypothetical protein GGR56DRAFT_645708 [Xylariaceae sp. FL0804]|nr:hypothetical protein GGR56DRAFT_645708 [Xylariaceae sp. FL0804]
MTQDQSPHADPSAGPGSSHAAKNTEDCNPTPYSPLELLPPELKLEVVKYLDDTTSIINLALTGPIHLKFVKDFETEIGGALVDACIDPSLVQLALTRLHTGIAKRKMPFIRRIGLADMYLKWKPQESTRALLNEAAQLLRFNSAVERYANDLARRALNDLHLYRQVREGLLALDKLSDKEIGRFRRALYIFQIISDIVAGDSILDYLDRFRSNRQPAWDRFWKHFAPWELYQVRSVQNLLAVRLQDGK